MMSANMVVVKNNLKREFLTPKMALDYFEAEEALLLMCVSGDAGLEMMASFERPVDGRVAIISGDEVRVAMAALQAYIELVDGQEENNAVSLYDRLEIL
jgi:hypothetical protein